jgi:hypothetical protein
VQATNTLSKNLRPSIGRSIFYLTGTLNGRHARIRRRSRSFMNNAG